MKDPKPKQPPKKKDEAAKPEAFDLWLNRGLHRLYDDVANEPIPEELRKLIDDDRAK